MFLSPCSFNQTGKYPGVFFPDTGSGIRRVRFIAQFRRFPHEIHSKNSGSFEISGLSRKTSDRTAQKIAAAAFREACRTGDVYAQLSIRVA
jgi:hypothetical protein